MVLFYFYYLKRSLFMRKLLYLLVLLGMIWSSKVLKAENGDTDAGKGGEGSLEARDEEDDADDAGDIPTIPAQNFENSGGEEEL
jgi:hypothetical protein